VHIVTSDLLFIMNTRPLKALATLLALLTGPWLGQAAENARPLLHPLFTDHMVLQRGVPAPVWGVAEPGAKVTVKFAGQEVSTTTGTDGKWLLRLKPLKTSSEPRQLEVACASGQRVQLTDIAVGDVWLCSGQSNMEMGIGACEATNDIAGADFPLLRLVTVPKRIAREPVETLECQWVRCTPQTVAQGGWAGFSAAGFYFGRKLQRDLSVPIGLIHSSWGGTLAEAWTSTEALQALPDFGERLDKFAEGRSKPETDADRKNPNVVTVLYNGMIAPLLPFAIKGAIWYQGESNADRAYQYRSLLPAMIQDWRARFGVGPFAFYIVQLAAWQSVHPVPRNNNWAELREAQALTAKNVKNSGMAVAIDIGDAADIHPKNKRDVGERLALAALAKTYGKDMEYSGPWYKKMKVDGSKVRLQFDHAKSGLAAKGDKLTGFAIAGADRRFEWADASIEGKSVVVSSPRVPQPVAVRYAWDINPECNLYNGAGLPAVPFRTDDWPGVTFGRK
jgi:sialate O-acetylesterase